MMENFTNVEREATHNGYSEKTIMINISLQEYRSLVGENATQRTIIDKMLLDIEKAESEANRWREKYFEVNRLVATREEKDR